MHTRHTSLFGNAVCTNTVGSFLCACKTGYAGDGVSECNDAGCPSLASHPIPSAVDQCVCAPGYSGDLTWDSGLQDWQGSCEVERCPANAVGHPICRCAKGYVEDTIEWSDVLATWLGGCTKVDCPDGSSNHPDCASERGYQGTLQWDGQSHVWVGYMLPSALCPSNAGSPRSCECSTGYAEQS